MLVFPKTDVFQLTRFALKIDISF